MYLAGHKRAASLSRLPTDNAAVLHAVLLPLSADPERGLWVSGGALVRPRRPALDREPSTSNRGRSLRAHLAYVERRHDAVWSEVWWTKPGSKTHHGYCRVRLPERARSRRGAVRRQILIVERAARAWVTPKALGTASAARRHARMRWDGYAAHVAAFLLLDGFGALPPHLPHEAAVAFAGCHQHGTAVALYKHRDAARRLIAGWETVGSE